MRLNDRVKVSPKFEFESNPAKIGKLKSKKQSFDSDLADFSLLAIALCEKRVGS